MCAVTLQVEIYVHTGNFMGFQLACCFQLSLLCLHFWGHAFFIIKRAKVYDNLESYLIVKKEQGRYK